MRWFWKKSSKAIKGDNKAKRTYPLSLKIDSSNRLLECNADVDGDAAVMKSNLCKELGGAWDDSLKTCTDPNPPEKKGYAVP